MENQNLHELHNWPKELMIGSGKAKYLKCPPALLSDLYMHTAVAGGHLHGV